MIDLPTLLTAVAAIVTALSGLWVARVKAKADRQAGKADRITQLEERITILESSIDAERTARHTAEFFAHQLRMGLYSALEHIERIHAWVESGRKPPPPTLDLEELKELLSSSS